MKIKLLGIDFRVGNGIALADMFDHIRQVGDVPTELGGHNRFMYVDTLGDFHVGLLITTKDHNKFLEFKHDKSAAKLEARDVSSGAKLADFNFFAIDKTTGKGIYQYYHQSCSLNTFGALCRWHYENLKTARIKDSKPDVEKRSVKEAKEINKLYSGTLKWDILVRKEAFDKLVAQLKQIRAVTLTVSTLAYKDTVFSPLSLVAKNMTQRFSFSKTASMSSVARSILAVSKRNNVEGAKVEGIDNDGLEQVIKLINTPDIFGEFDFDRIAESMTIAPMDFAQSEFLREIIKVAQREPVLRDSIRK